MIRPRPALRNRSLGPGWAVLSLLFLIAGSSVLSAQDEPIQVTATSSSQSVRIGDVIEYQVKVEYSPDLIVQMPGAQTKFGEFEIRGVDVPPPVETGAGRFSALANFELMAFKTGELEIPSVEIQYTTQAGEESSLSTEPVKITVVSVITDETQDIEDIKPPWEMPRDWWFWIILIALGLLLLAAALYWWFRRRRVSPQAELQWVDPRPAHEIALEALRRLRESKLLDRREIGRFHVEASEIVRRYLEGRFEVEAMEMATSDVLEGLDRGRLPLKEHELLRAFLGQCDMVKFAKLVPERSRCEALLTEAVAFVEATRPSEPAEVTGGEEAKADEKTPGPESEHHHSRSDLSSTGSGEDR